MLLSGDAVPRSAPAQSRAPDAAQRRPASIAAGLRRAGLELVVEPTGDRRRPGRRLHQSPARGEVDRVIVAGGDGTINPAVQALVETGPATRHHPARHRQQPGADARACHTIWRAHRDRGGARHRRPDRPRPGERALVLHHREHRPERTDHRGAVRREQATLWAGRVRARRRSRCCAGRRPFHAEISWQGGSAPHAHGADRGRQRAILRRASPVAEDAAIDDARLDLYTIEVQPLVGSSRPWRPRSSAERQGERRRCEAIRASEFEIRTRPSARRSTWTERSAAETPATFEVVPARARGLHA